MTTLQKLDALDEHYYVLRKLVKNESHADVLLIQDDVGDTLPDLQGGVLTHHKCAALNQSLNHKHLLIVRSYASGN